LSLPQLRLWLLAELDRDDPTYNVPLAFRLRGELDVSALESALNALVRRHDVLCSVVHVDKGEPSYIVDQTFTLEAHCTEILHGSIDGAGHYSLELARYLPEDRPIYILPPHGVDGGHLPATIEAMAAEYVELVRAARPCGPYALGGWCNGGLVAFEMARQLRGQNEHVSNVVLIEVGDANRFLRALIEKVDRLRQWLKIDHQRRSGLVRVLARVPFQVRRLFVRSSRRTLIQKATSSVLCLLRGQRGVCQRDGALSGPSSGNLLRDFARVSEAYIPRRYDGRITVLVAENRSLKRMPTVGWTAVAQQVDARTIPGDHVSCVSDYVHETARELAGVVSN
jgi:thioesterase domain-containing protein